MTIQQQISWSCLQLHLKIHNLQEYIHQLEFKINKLEKIEQLYYELLNQNQIDTSTAITGQDVNEFLTQVPNLSDIFIEMFWQTINDSKRPMYSFAYKKFAYTLYCISPSAYRMLKQFIKLPSKSCDLSIYDKNY